MEYCSAVRRDEILPFVVVWMDLENITVRNKSGGKIQEPSDFTHNVGYKTRSNK